MTIATEERLSEFLALVLDDDELVRSEFESMLQEWGEAQERPVPSGGRRPAVTVAEPPPALGRPAGDGGVDGASLLPVDNWARQRSPPAEPVPSG